MVDTHTNGEDQPETSRDGLRRMQRLVEASRTRSSASSSAFHPLTSTIIYPPTGSGRRHLLTSIFTETPLRSFPLPPIFERAQTFSVSPDGRWVTAYHLATDPSAAPLQAVNGDLYFFPGKILDSSTVRGTFNCTANFPMGPPLAVLHVYPPRTRLNGDKAAPALGPTPPPGHGAACSHGPTLVVLTADMVYFLHPHPVPATIVLDTRSSAAAPHESVSATTTGEAHLNWTINALKCPIGSRSYTDLSSVATQQGVNTPYGAQRGWLGMVGGNDAVWAAVEKDGDVRIIRIEIGLDANNMPYLATTPLPALPRPRTPPLPDGSTPHAFLDQVVFVPLRDHAVNGTAEEKEEMKAVKDEASSAIGAVMVYRDVDETMSQARSRSRFELCELRHRPVATVDSFKDLGGGGDEVFAPLDWTPAPRMRTTAVSPVGTSILALTPLPDAPPHTLAMALVASPTSVALAHVNLIPPAEGDTAGAGEPRWPVLVGEEYQLDPSIATSGDVTLLPSNGVKRGEMGLVAILGAMRPILNPSPRLGAGATPNETLKHTAERAARSVELAVAQGVDYSDVMRAAFAMVPRSEAGALGTAIIEKAFALFFKRSRKYVTHLLRLQVAVWALANDPRKVLANELIRLTEAVQVFYLCGEERDGVISFDLDSVWNLVDVFEWSLSKLGQIFREAIGERAQTDWAPGETRTEGSGRILFLLHPLLRGILKRHISLLAAFAKFAINLDKPIRPPETAFLLTRAAQASAVATQRVLDALDREGVDLTLWGDVLGTMGKTGPRPADADVAAALLRLDIAPLASLLPAVLQHLPTPSSLFLAPTNPPERDGANCSVIGDRPTTKCDRCGARTIPPIQNVLRGGVPSPWAAWRRTFISGCICGGTWQKSFVDISRK